MLTRSVGVQPGPSSGGGAGIIIGLVSVERRRKHRWIARAPSHADMNRARGWALRLAGAGGRRPRTSTSYSAVVSASRRCCRRCCCCCCGRVQLSYRASSSLEAASLLLSIRQLSSCTSSSSTRLTLPIVVALLQHLQQQNGT